MVVSEGVSPLAVSTDLLGIILCIAIIYYSYPATFLVLIC